MSCQNGNLEGDDVSFSMAKPTVTKTFRLPLELATSLEAQAALHQQSLNAYLLIILERELEQSPTRHAEELLATARAMVAPPASGKAFAQLLIPPTTPPTTPNPIWDAVGYMRIAQNLDIAAADDSATAILGDLTGASLTQFRGLGTYDVAWDDLVICCKAGQPCDAQLVLYHPTDPSSPIFVGLACLFEAPWFYVRIHKVWENGQWVRKRQIRLDVPEGIRPKV